MYDVEVEDSTIPLQQSVAHASPDDTQTFQLTYNKLSVTQQQQKITRIWIKIG